MKNKNRKISDHQTPCVNTNKPVVFNFLFDRGNRDTITSEYYLDQPSMSFNFSLFWWLEWKLPQIITNENVFSSFSFFLRFKSSEIFISYLQEQPVFIFAFKYRLSSESARSVFSSILVFFFVVVKAAIALGHFFSRHAKPFSSSRVGIRFSAECLMFSSSDLIFLFAQKSFLRIQETNETWFPWRRIKFSFSARLKSPRDISWCLQWRCWQNKRNIVFIWLNIQQQNVESR